MMLRSHNMRHGLAGFSLVLCTMAAQAQQSEVYRPITAKELLAGFMEGGLASWVEDPAQRSSLSTFMATAYVLGTADSVKGHQWCSEQDVRIDALSAAVMDYLADLPQTRHQESAAKVVAEALGKAYPCKQ
jgi:hypothetical protein